MKSKPITLRLNMDAEKLLKRYTKGKKVSNSVAVDRFILHCLEGDECWKQNKK